MPSQPRGAGLLSTRTVIGVYGQEPGIASCFLILYQMGEFLIGFSSRQAVSLQKIGVFYREVRTPRALVYNSLGYQFGSCQESSVPTDFELKWFSELGF